MFGWLRRRRRKKWLAQPFPGEWQPVLESLPFFAHLTESERERLRSIVVVLFHEKKWEGCGGLTLSDEMRVAIAGQAALLIVNLEHGYYRDLSTILVYPGAYRSPGRHRTEGGVMAEGHHRAGEAWHRGPVVLSWDDAKRGALNSKDGRNLVYHEFAHKLDQLDGVSDGTPPLAGRDAYPMWHEVMTREYEELCGALETREPTLLDKYGTTNPAEFFAVTTECFFERPVRLERRHPELYERFAGYFRQDPARWFDDS